MILWCIGIFIVDFIVSFAWARGIKAIADNKALKSGLWAGFITLAGAVTIISYTENKWLLIPAVLGSFLGTYLSVKYKK